MTTNIGITLISGQFYNSNVPREIYNSLYTSDDFKSWLQKPEVVRGNWYNLKLIDMALNNPSSVNVSFGDPNYNKAMTAKLYTDVMMTPLNLGIPYLDETTLNKMFKWNLAQLFSNCNSESIRVDENNRSYVAFKGFKIYADMATITNLEYKTYNLDSASERIEFNRITNIDPDNLGFEYDTNLRKNIASSEDERKRVCVVGINYSVPITYEGITPIKKIFNFVWNSEVDGINGSAERQGAQQQWVDDVQNLESGGLNGNTAVSGVLPVPGKLIYYVIR